MASDSALAVRVLADTVGTLSGLLHAEVTTELRSVKRAARIRPEVVA